MESQKEVNYEVTGSTGEYFDFIFQAANLNRVWLGSTFSFLQLDISHLASFPSLLTKWSISGC